MHNQALAADRKRPRPLKSRVRARIMKKMNEDDLDGSGLEELVSRMDKFLASPYWSRRGNDILNLHVCSIVESSVVKRFSSEFQRKVAYKAFGLLLQLHYTGLSSSAQFFRLPEHDDIEAKQIYSAARYQWTTVSSRIAFEYFMHLTYMLGTGLDFNPSRSATKKYKKWLKEHDNPYTYFAISAARAAQFDRTIRSPEVHASTRLARRVLLQTATDIDNSVFQLSNILKNQWQFILDIANEREPNGWAASGKAEGDEEWYALWQSGDHEAIEGEIDRMFLEIEAESEEL